MKTIDIDTLQDLPTQPIGDDETFKFQCHPALSCFNRCCRNLNLFLYPYDVVRLKQRLRIDSDLFIERYTDVVLRQNNHFPEVLLKMSENEEKTCPFLTEGGCSVYPDRPDACRTFPVEIGLFYDAVKKATQSVYFFKPPDFCMGRHEPEVWTPKAYIENQEAAVYHKFNSQWADIRRNFQNDPWRGEGPNGARAKMTFMTVYNIDRFRDFIFKSSFLKRYKLSHDLKKQIQTDDVELLKLGFEWVHVFLWDARSRRIRLR